MAAELYVQRAKRDFDLVFCDPPFPYEFKWELVREITLSPILKTGSKLLIHRPREDPCKEMMESIQLEESKEYGRSMVDFFIKK
jgi:16S rRNA G966 N2-methylase RsmD